MSGVRKDPDLAVLCMHHASVQQVTQNTVKASVLQNRITFQLGNTESYEVIAYMGIVSALKILSGLQRHIPHFCEHGYGHNFMTNSNALMQLLTAPAQPLPPGDLSSHTPPLHPLQLNFKSNPTANVKDTSSKVTPKGTPVWINHSHPRSDSAGQSVPFFLFLPGEF